MIKSPVLTRNFYQIFGNPKRWDSTGLIVRQSIRRVEVPEPDRGRGFSTSTEPVRIPIRFRTFLPLRIYLMHTFSSNTSGLCSILNHL